MQKRGGNGDSSALADKTGSGSLGVRAVQACYRLDLGDGGWLGGVLREAAALGGAARGRAVYSHAEGEPTRAEFEADPPGGRPAAPGAGGVDVSIPLPAAGARGGLSLHLELARPAPTWARWVEHLTHGARLRVALRSSLGAEHEATAPPLAALRGVVLPAADGGEVIPGGALAELWDGAIRGRWTVLDRYAHGVGRVVTLRRNPDGQPDPRGLTPREAEVAARIAEGHTNKHIAFALGVAEGTVAALGRHVMTKLGARGRVLVHDLYLGPTAAGVRARVADVQAGAELLRVVAWEPPAASATLRGLSPSEHAVVEAVVAGLSNTAIARARGTSDRTVANQVAAVFKKLRVNSRSELVRLLRDGGAD